MPDAPLTRETLAELRRLGDTAATAFRDYLGACDGPHEEQMWRVFADADEARNGLVRKHLLALLAAAERGLGAGDGR